VDGGHIQSKGRGLKCQEGEGLGRVQNWSEGKNKVVWGKAKKGDGLDTCSLPCN
jgi:hypothetical protein